ncbi:agmatinase [Fodinisporobacter ferrooxydans]|uniref:Agmatinase n=1 Tax=Fodinisporobacter ferrooxydans TaxID=2901836 RepID=A0ABY4CMB1_9BACL|nr:agmatinase [Alicyclobacillaceae bacterium MYW30-H2]
MKFDDAYSGNVFIGATSDYGKAQAVIYGMPMDWTTSFRPGTRLGPKRIREVSLGLEEYSPYLDRELGEVAYFDAGDIPLPFGNPARSVEMIRDYVKQLLAHGKLPIGLGGEHLVTWGPVQAVYEKYPNLALVHLDAHTDLREHYEGEPYSHAAVIRKIVDMIGGKNVYQFGIRSGMREEFMFAKENTNFHPFTVLEPLKQRIEELKGRPVYVTIDIDVVDPAFAPGTGTAEAGGITSAEVLQAVHLMKQLNVVGFDLVEVAPVLDPTEQTQILASKIIREALLSFIR